MNETNNSQFSNSSIVYWLHLLLSPDITRVGERPTALTNHNASRLPSLDSIITACRGQGLVAVSLTSPFPTYPIILCEAAMDSTNEIPAGAKTSEQKESQQSKDSQTAAE